MKRRLDLDATHWAMIDAAGATLRIDARMEFRRQLFSWLERNCSQTPSNEDVQNAVLRTIGILPVGYQL